MSPTPPTTPAGSGPSSVRAIVNWLETSGTNNNGGKRDKAGGLPAVSRDSHARTTSTLASPSPQAPSPKLPPLPKVLAPPRSSGKSIAAAPAVLSPPGHSAEPAKPGTSPAPVPSIHRGKGASEDYSLTMLRHNACFHQPQSTNRGQEQNGTRERKAAVRNGPGKKKSYGNLGEIRTSSSKTVEELSERHSVKGDGGGGTGNNRPRRYKEEVRTKPDSIKRRCQDEQLRILLLPS
ncbi:hypothetical protein F503_05151 [Ophiostoma piceae UAMH 11346]|uniref:Uncharacterized protein n=1 Tax=Ophiostoma piceae (strain UAMH 11346) TaxID=1262450 RepID=S3CDG3_OPHP1|nr:hypothetical protein F503_05151 [Ophiostoma piceae UAMH 11346]